MDSTATAAAGRDGRSHRYAISGPGPQWASRRRGDATETHRTHVTTPRGRDPVQRLPLVVGFGLVEGISLRGDAGDRIAVKAHQDQPIIWMAASVSATVAGV
jgi:hypothetical protein